MVYWNALLTYFPVGLPDLLRWMDDYSGHVIELVAVLLLCSYLIDRLGVGPLLSLDMWTDSVPERERGIIIDC